MPLNLISDEPRPTANDTIASLVRVNTDAENLPKLTTHECSICKEDYKISEKLIELPCKHLFHEDCI